jgi:predicted FMN-binding regulatory protein PaiB
MSRPDWYGVADQVPTWNYIAGHIPTGTLGSCRRAMHEIWFANPAA